MERAFEITLDYLKVNKTSCTLTSNVDLTIGGDLTVTDGTLNLEARGVYERAVVSGLIINSRSSGGGGGDTIPEPSTAALALMGLGGMAMLRRRKDA